ncbi:MAG TPA: hypothetical protein VHD62_11060 [Opitutaceae bacterium]|nr:hypothetical protein [Opitutaceae bacterium]
MKLLRTSCFARRAATGLLALALATGWTGCIGRKEAADFTGKLGAASLGAAKTVTDLKDAHAKTVAAFNVGVTTALDATDALASDRAEAQLTAAFESQLAELEKARGDSLARVAALRRSNFDLAMAKIDHELAPIQSRLDDEKRAVDAAVLASNQFAGDLDRRLKMTEANARYLAIATQGLLIESEGRTLAIQGLDQNVLGYETAVEKFATTTRADLTKQYNDALTRLKKAKTARPAIAPLLDNAEAYAALGSYVATVQQGTKAMDDYLKLNSFGTGSFLDVFGSSVIHGLPAAFKDVATGKTTSLADVVTEAKTVATQAGGEVVSDFTNSASELVKKFRTDAGSVGTELAGQLGDALKKLGTDKLKEFSDQIAKLK